MKTYQAMLESSHSYDEQLNVYKKPVFRSSAIFPFMVGETTNAFIHFMGYWLFKRNIKEISLLYTIRNHGGNILKRDTIFIDRVKAFLIDVRNELSGCAPGAIDGSIELEVFSVRDMVFPYPAFVLEYSSAQGSSFVHTAGRVYNDFEDLTENEAFKVAETGFDIYPNGVGYFSFVNGAVAADGVELKIDVVNCAGEIRNNTICFDRLRPFEAKTVGVQHFDPVFARGKNLFAKIAHNLHGIFPRFIAGNMGDEREFITLTHTYYDTSEVVGDDHYWKNSDTHALNDASVFVPVFGGACFETQLVIYPIYAPQSFKYSIHAFAKDGSRINVPVRDGYFDSSGGKALYIILSDSGGEEISGARIDFDGGGTLPTRLKFGLNVSRLGRHHATPSNICFNAEPSNPKLLSKPGTTKWAPIPNRHRSIISISNASWVKAYQRQAKVTLNFWRQQDELSLVRLHVIPANGLHFVDTQSDSELVSFLGGVPGWVTIESDNPFVNAWYFEVSDKGLVGADHSF